MNGRELKQKLKAHKISIGAWSTSYDTTIAVMLARVGFDWVIIDQEHAPYNCAHTSSTSLLRISECET